MVTPADIRRLHADDFEFLWRTLLRQEHGVSYRHVDAHGIDCLTDNRAYQVYHHQSAAWAVVQGKFRDDVQAAQDARTKGRFKFDEWVFITTFPFKDPSQRAWLDEQIAKALPLRVHTWGDEDLCNQLARYPHIARQFGLGPGQRNVTAGIMAQGGAGGGHGINIEGGLHIVGATATAPASVPPFLAEPPETIEQQAARLHREQEEENEKVALLATKGAELAAKEALALFDAMAKLVTNIGGGRVERDDQRYQACFHACGFTVGAQWHPSTYINTVWDGTLGVTLWGGEYLLRPAVFLHEPSRLRTTAYTFDVTPKTHEPVWKPKGEHSRPLSTSALAEREIRQLLDHIEKVRRER